MRYLIAIVMLVSFLPGCASKTVNPEEMTPVQIATWANQIYADQYQAYIEDFDLYKNHELLKVTLKKRKAALDAVWPVLMAYNAVLLDGGVPGPTVTDELVRLVYRLTGVL